MKNQFLKILPLSIIVFVLISCSTPEFLKETKRQRILGEMYTEEAKYLAIDSINNTPEKRAKFKELREKFLKVWLDSNSCYSKVISHKEDIKDVSFANILYSPNYDTLLFLVSWYSEGFDVGSNSTWNMTNARGIGAIIDSLGNLRFECKAMTPGLFATNDKNRMREFNFHLKRYVAKARFLKEDKTPDPTFWYRSYNVPNFYSKDWEIPEELLN